MMSEFGGRSQRAAALWLCGFAGLTAVTWLGTRLGLNFSTAAFAYLLLVVILSLFDSLVLSLAASFAAATCLIFFFVDPLFSLNISRVQDLTALAAFTATSIVIASLAHRVRVLTMARQETEIASRRAAEQALTQSERRYHNLFQAMAASFWELDFSGANAMVRNLMKSGVTDLRRHFADNPSFVRDMMRRTLVLDVNDQTVALFGGSRQELLGSVEPFWPEESTAVYADAYVGAVEGKPNFSTECRLRRLDGSLFHALFTVAYPSREMGKGATMVGVIDITARKQYEAAVRISEQRYQNLFQAMAVSFWEIDFSGVNDVLRGLRASGITDLRRHFRENPSAVCAFMRATRVIDVNDQTVALFGRGSKQELLGNTEPMWPEESWPDYAESILSALEQKTSFSVETRLTRLDGTAFDAHFTVWYSADDRTRGLAGVLDISERVQARTRLEQSEQRYRTLFHHMPIPLWRMNSTRLLALLNEARAQGVTDLGRHIDDNPEFLQRAMEAIVIEEVNRSTIDLFGAKHAGELVGSVAPY
jgi:PAS domain S-box-containing protein